MRRQRHLQHEHTSLRCARSFTTGRTQGRVCGPLYSTCATARVVLVMQPPRRSCWGVSQHSPRETRGVPQTSKQQPSLLRLERFKRAPVLAHGVLYMRLPTARTCGRLRYTLPPPSPLLAGRWAPSALRRWRHFANTSMPRFGVLDPSQRAARKDACAAPSTRPVPWYRSVSYTHLRAHETSAHLVCRLLLEKKN